MRLSRLKIVSLLFVGLLFQGGMSAQAGKKYDDFCETFNYISVNGLRGVSENNMGLLKKKFKADPLKLFNQLSSITLPRNLDLDEKQSKELSTALSKHSKNIALVEMGVNFPRVRASLLRNEFKSRAEAGDPVAIAVMLSVVAAD